MSVCVRAVYGRAPHDQRCGAGALEPERRPGHLVASSNGRSLLAVVCLRVYAWRWISRRCGGGAGFGELRGWSPAPLRTNKRFARTSTRSAKRQCTARQGCLEHRWHWSMHRRCTGGQVHCPLVGNRRISSGGAGDMGPSMGRDGVCGVGWEGRGARPGRDAAKRGSEHTGTTRSTRSR